MNLQSKAIQVPGPFPFVIYPTIPLNSDQRQKLREEFERIHTGPGQSKVLIMPPGWRVESLTPKPSPSRRAVHFLAAALLVAVGAAIAWLSGSHAP